MGAFFSLSPCLFRHGERVGVRGSGLLRAGVLMLALLIAVIGSVSADSIAWHSAVANIPGPAGQQL